MQIFFCPKCGNELESVAWDKFTNKYNEITHQYELAIASHLKSMWTFSWVYVFLDISCSCSNKAKAVFYSRFFEEGPQKEDFKLVHIHEASFNKLSGQFSRIECRSALERLLIRWNNLALKTYLATPFIGGFKKKQNKGPFLFP